MGFTSLEDCCDPLYLWVINRHKMKAKFIRRSSPPCDFDTAVSMLLMDELEDGGVGSSSDTALAVYKPPRAAAAGAGSPSPNQGKTKRKQFTNSGGSGNTTPAPTPTAPWTGYVHAYPMCLPPPPRPPGGPGVPGLLGTLHHTHAAFAPVQYAQYPHVPYQLGQHPYQFQQQQQQSYHYHQQQLPYQPPLPHQQHVQHGVHESDVDQAALMGALQNLTLQNSGNGWVADSGATSHMTSDHCMPSHSTLISHYPPVLVGNGSSMPVLRVGSASLPASHRSLLLNDVLIAPTLIKNLLSVHRFTTNNNCSMEFDPYGLSVKDYTAKAE